MPKRGFHRLKKQVVDSSESIVWNIVEGCGADTRKEFARFLGMSIRSTMEAQSQLEVARDTRALAPERFSALSAEVVQIRKMLCGLRAALRRADTRAKSERPSAAEVRH